MTTTYPLSLYFLCLLLNLFFFLNSHAKNISPIVVTDSLQRTVILQQPAKRIVALAPHIVENLYSAGAGNTIVGAVDYCDYPKAALDIERVGAINSVSLEKIISLKPDLVIVWTSGNGLKVLKQLERLNITTYASNPKTFNDIAQSIHDFGLITGHVNTAQKSAHALLQKVHQLKKRFSHKKTVSLFYQVWSKPLLSLNDKQILGDVIALCGGKNIFGNTAALVPKISIESVINLQPHVMISTRKPEDKSYTLDHWKAHTTIPAVTQNHLYYIHPDIISRHSARITQGAEALCQHLEKAR